MPAAYPAYLILLYFISLRVQVMSFLLIKLSPPSCQFSLLVLVLAIKQLNAQNLLL